MSTTKLKLNKIVEEYLFESLGETTLHKYPRILQIAISGLREFNRDVEGLVKTVQLTVNENDTVTLPQDFIDYRIIGVCTEFGTIESLGVNDRMCLPVVDDCGNIVGSPNRNENVPFSSFDAFYFQGTYSRNGQLIGRRFGIGGGQNQWGYYRVWPERGYITLQNYIGNNIVLEYLADIDLIDEDYQVHPFLVEALKSWIYWKYIQRNRNYSQGEKDMARREYYNQKRLAKKAINMFNLKELLQAFRTFYGPSVHY